MCTVSGKDFLSENLGKYLKVIKKYLVTKYQITELKKVFLVYSRQNPRSLHNVVVSIGPECAHFSSRTCKCKFLHERENCMKVKY